MSKTSFGLGNSLGSTIALSGVGPGNSANFAAAGNINQLVRQEQHLGFIRNLQPPQEHIGLGIAPFMNVATDDVVFDLLNDTGSGLAPAAAQDAESVLFQDSEDFTGQMRASVMDWRLKSRYSSSDVMTYREFLATAETLQGANASVPLYVTNITDGFSSKIARDTAKRKQYLDNRIEWLILTALSNGRIVYNDGVIKFDVNFGRPADQHNRNPLKGSGDYTGTSTDPINNAIAVKEFMFERYGVIIDRAYVSRKYLNRIVNSSKFGARFVDGSGTVQDPKYFLANWGPQSAIDIFERETEIKLIANDNIFRDRDPKTGIITNQRFIPQNQVIYMPSEASVNLQDETEIGFAKTLTSPHPMGGFTQGFYSWEQEETDPWQRVIGSGIKAFPIFPHMEWTYTETVTL